MIFSESKPGTHRNRLILFALWIVFYASFTLITPPLLDDADSVHAEVAREMLLRHDWVTLYANGIRYLEKAPLLYWSMAASMKLFGVGAAAARLPLALTVLALAFALESFGRRAFDSARAGLYAALITLSSFGIFIFTRITIPDALVCLWITLALFCYWRNTQQAAPDRLLCYGFAACCALNVLTKGLIGIVFPIAIVLLHLLALDGVRVTLSSIRRLYPISSIAIFLDIAAPWHIFAALANPTQGRPDPITFVHGHWSVPLPTDGNVHGWTWFYFVNEHLLRYLNLRVPRDYDTVPLLLFYALLFVWLMPWSAFLPHAFATVPWRKSLRRVMPRSPGLHRFLPRSPRLHRLMSETSPLLAGSSTLHRLLAGPLSRLSQAPDPERAQRVEAEAEEHASRHPPPILANQSLSPLEQTRLLLGIWAAVVMLFFSFSTRQEYYVLPALPALILLIAGWLKEETEEADTFTIPNPCMQSGQRIGFVLFLLGSAAALAAAFFALKSRSPNGNVDLAALLKQNPGDYALSFGHFLDLNARAMGAFRIPLVLTAVALFTSTFFSWRFRREFKPHAGTLSLAAGAFLFLLAAHGGLRIFSPVLTSQQLAAAMQPQLKPPGSRFPDLIVINGEYEAASTLGFYLQRPWYTGRNTPPLPKQSSSPGTRYPIPDTSSQTLSPSSPASDPSSTHLVPGTAIHILNGRSSNLWYGSFFPDAPHIFEDDISIQLLWTGDRRVFLWTEPDHVPKLPGRTYLIAQSGGKEILSNQPNPF